MEALRKKKMLLVLDNCEHLVDAAARLMETLLDSCPRLRVLATSREALGVAGEVTRPVPSLSVPDPRDQLKIEKLEGYESARLFVERAVSKWPDFALTPENAQDVAKICWHLEGIPLAIELAATWVGTLAVEQISERLKGSIKLLKSGSRTVTPRQQTLRGATGWSYDLLDEPERKLFGRFSVFAGGWMLEAAETVEPGDDIEEEDVLELLSELVDKSLVVAQTGTEGVARYRMLELIRQYAQERLESSGEADAVRRRHAAFFLALAEDAEPELSGGAQQGAWLERLEAELDNLRASLSWSLEAEPETVLRLAGSLARFWEIRSDFLEGGRWLEAALSQNDHAEARARAKALTEAGTCAWHRADYERATVLHGEALGLYRELEDERGAAFALNCLGTQELEQGDYEHAAAIFEEALAVCRRLGDKRTTAYVLGNLGEVEQQRGNSGQGITLVAEALSLFREMGDNLYVAYALSLLGRVAAYQGDDREAAVKFIREGLPLARELGSGNSATMCLEGLAALAGAKAKGECAAKLYGAAEALRDAIGAPLSPSDRPDYERHLNAARAQLDGAAWEAAWEKGKAMTLEEAVDYALSEKEEPPVSPPVPERASTGAQPPDLTRREKEVAALIVRGLTNRRIAEELVVSERIVDKHVRNILKKLGLNSRERVAARLPR